MSDHRLEEIERQIRHWMARPPSRSPAVARTRVSARIRSQSKPRQRRFAVAMGALVAAALTAGLLLLQLRRGPGPAPSFAAPPDASLLVFQLDSGTKLYLTLSSRHAASTDTTP